MKWRERMKRDVSRLFLPSTQCDIVSVVSILLQRKKPSIIHDYSDYQRTSVYFSWLVVSKQVYMPSVYWYFTEFLFIEAKLISDIFRTTKYTRIQHIDFFSSIVNEPGLPLFQVSRRVTDSHRILYGLVIDLCMVFFR